MTYLFFSPESRVDAILANLPIYPAPKINTQLCPVASTQNRCNSSHQPLMNISGMVDALSHLTQLGGGGAKGPGRSITNPTEQIFTKLLRSTEACYGTNLRVSHSSRTWSQHVDGLVQHGHWRFRLQLEKTARSLPKIHGALLIYN